MAKNKSKNNIDDDKKTKNISITNDFVRSLLFTSANASKLIEESILFYVYAMENNLLDERELNRIFAQGLIKLK